MKDEETVKCEHGMDVFEVSPPAPPRPHSHHHNHSPNHANFPLPPPSCSIPSGWLHHALLAGGVVGSSVAVLANDAPHPTNPPTLTTLCTHTNTHLCRPTAASMPGPLWLTFHRGGCPATPSSSHMLLAAGSPAGTHRPPTFALAGTPLNLSHTHKYTHEH